MNCCSMGTPREPSRNSLHEKNTFSIGFFRSGKEMFFLFYFPYKTNTWKMFIELINTVLHLLFLCQTLVTGLNCWYCTQNIQYPTCVVLVHIWAMNILREYNCIEYSTVAMFTHRSSTVSHILPEFVSCGKHFTVLPGKEYLLVYAVYTKENRYCAKLKIAESIIIITLMPILMSIKSI